MDARMGIAKETVVLITGTAVSFVYYCIFCLKFKPAKSACY